MVSTAQLKKQISRERSKIKKIKEADSLRLERIGLEKELKLLKRTPSQKRTAQTLARIRRGSKILGKKAADAAVRQAKRIREQQERDLAKDVKLAKGTKNGKQVIITRTITGKGKKRKVSTKRRIIGTKKTQKKERTISDEIFGGLDF